MSETTMAERRLVQSIAEDVTRAEVVQSRQTHDEWI